MGGMQSWRSRENADRDATIKRKITDGKILKNVT
jgi:hypothetical protein